MDKKDTIKLRKFVAPEIVFGIGAINLAGQYIKKFASKKTLIVTDSGIEHAGWTHKVIESVETAKIGYVTFNDVTPNPKDHEVMNGCDVYTNNNCDSIIAVGGGSVIDCAKAIGIVSANKKHILEFEGIDRLIVPIPPIICIPTTGGTSADVSQFVIITDTKARNKIAIISKAVVPDIALVDPVTLTTMDDYLSACTGIDALVHAIEAFVSNISSPLTDVHAIDAIKLISKHLFNSVKEPKNFELKSKIMQASLEAGLAFSNASLGAVHAMAHSLGGYLDLAHGECNAMLLKTVVAYNFKSVPDKFKTIANALGIDLKGLTTKEVKNKILHKIESLVLQVGIKDTLGSKGVKMCDIPDLSARAVKDPCIITNPRKTSEKDVEILYSESL